MSLNDHFFQALSKAKSTFASNLSYSYLNFCCIFLEFIGVIWTSVVLAPRKSFRSGDISAPQHFSSFSWHKNGISHLFQSAEVGGEGDGKNTDSKQWYRWTKVLPHTQQWLHHWPFDQVLVICFSIHFPLKSLLFLSSSQKLFLLQLVISSLCLHRKRGSAQCESWQLRGLLPPITSQDWKMKVVQKQKWKGAKDDYAKKNWVQGRLICKGVSYFSFHWNKRKLKKKTTQLICLIYPHPETINKTIWEGSWKWCCNLFLILVTSLEKITVGSALGSGTHRVAAATEHSNTKSSPKSQKCFIQDPELNSAIILVLITKSFMCIMSFPQGIGGLSWLQHL